MSEHRKTREMVSERVRQRNEQTRRDAREDLVLDNLVQSSTNVHANISARPEVININQEEEHRARSLVHARIVESLKYSTMTSRYEDVIEAYPKNFDWLFDESAAPALTSLQSTSERP